MYADVEFPRKFTAWLFCVVDIWSDNNQKKTLDAGPNAQPPLMIRFLGQLAKPKFLPAITLDILLCCAPDRVSAGEAKEYLLNCGLRNSIPNYRIVVYIAMSRKENSHNESVMLIFSPILR
jgi:hypothetical protein